MKNIQKATLLMVMCIYITACADTLPVALPKQLQADQYPIVSYNVVETKTINKSIHEAVKNKEEWVYSPILIAIKYTKASDASFTSILAKSDGGEQPTTSTITIVEDGYLDDSVRGGWFQLYLNKNNTKHIWEVKEIREAYLCGRANSINSFSKESCP